VTTRLIIIVVDIKLGSSITSEYDDLSYIPGLKWIKPSRQNDRNDHERNSGVGSSIFLVMA